MKCVVPSQNVKVLAKAFHSLGKIGEDLFIEPYRNHIIFRTVNMAESAYASFTFTRPFFSSFTFNDNDDEECLKCKISMKSLLVVLKLQHGDRLMEWCQLRLDPSGTKVIFQLRFSHGCTKTHFLPILESEILQANYSKDDCQNHISAPPKLLSPVAKNFHSTEEEITLCVTSQKLILKTHLDNNLDSKKALRTEICLHSVEFEDYNIRHQTSITFCLKELRAVLFFAEFTGLPVHFYLSSAGKPVIFVVHNESVYEANYVVSTLSETGASQSLSQMSENIEKTNSKESVNSKKRPQEEPDNTSLSSIQQLSKRPCSEMYPLSHEKKFNRLDLCGFNSESMNSDSIENNIATGPQFLDDLEVTGDSNITQPIVKSIFSRCFNTTFRKQSLPGYNEVIANDSDEMNDSD